MISTCLEQCQFKETITQVVVCASISKQFAQVCLGQSNRAAKVILQAKYEVSSRLLFETQKWDQLTVRRKNQKAMMMLSPSTDNRF